MLSGKTEEAPSIRRLRGPDASPVRNELPVDRLYSTALERE